MNNLFKALLLLLVFTASCSTDDVADEIITELPANNKIDITINGEPPVHTIRDLTASFCCSNRISVSFNLRNESNGTGRSSFWVSLDKNGNLLGLGYNDFKNPSTDFYSPFFTPTSTLTITDFEFVENQILKFKVSGEIFEETHNFFTIPEPTDITATIEMTDFHKCSCNTFSSSLQLSDDYIFSRFTRSTIGNDIRYFSHANNGYQVELTNFTNSLRNMPVGIYNFDENSTTERINFRKFIGQPRAFSYTIIPQEWLTYDTAGSFEILERTRQSNGQLVTKVKFNLVVSENNVVIHQFSNGIIETQS